MLAAASQAFADILTPPFRSVLLKSLALTIGLLVVIWLALQGASLYFIDVTTYPWVETILVILTGIGFFIGLGFLVAPITSLLAGLFADEVAEVVERTHYPDDPPGRALPFGEQLVTTLKFTGVVILGNLVALLLLLVPGVNIAAFFVVNGYLLGREYFEGAAMRFRTPEEARTLRKRHGGTVFVAGLLIALVLAIPILNLVTPLFATAFMAHLNKRLSARPA